MNHLTTEENSVKLEYYGVYGTSIIEKKELFNDPKFSLKLPLHIDNIVAAITDYVWAEDLETDEHIIKEPRTWWDHFKRDAIPTFQRWLRMPIHYTVNRVVFNRKAIYPKFRHSGHRGTDTFIIKETKAEFKEQ